MTQRHASIFASGIGSDLTATQWAALAKLAEIGPVSQNHLGRHTAMDAATIKGVVDRLTRRGLTATQPDREDARRLTITLTAAGQDLVEQLTPNAVRVTALTVAPLTPAEQETLTRLLLRLR